MRGTNMEIKIMFFRMCEDIGGPNNLNLSSIELEYADSRKKTL